MDDQDKLDRFLDRALSDGGNVSPRAGLEQRILASLEAQGNKRRVLRWRWAAIPAFAMILVCAFIIESRLHREKRVETATVQHRGETATMATPTIRKTANTLVNTVPPQSQRVRHTRPTQGTRENAEPRRATFPSTPGDDDLVRLATTFAQNHPGIASQITREQNDFRQMAAAFTAPLAERNHQH